MKKSLTLALCILMVISLCGCTKTISYTFNVETGDSIKISLSTTDEDYTLRQDSGQFYIMEGDTQAAYGGFLSENKYEQLSNADIPENVTIFDSYEGDVSYIAYERQTDDGIEVNYVCQLGNTGVLVRSYEPREKVQEIFSLLDIELE